MVQAGTALFALFDCTCWMRDIDTVCECKSLDRKNQLKPLPFRFRQSLAPGVGHSVRNGETSHRSG